MKKVISTIVVVAVLALVVLRTDAPTTMFPTPKPDPVTITLVGDIMMDRGVRRSIENMFGGEYGALFINTSYLGESDITFGNFEGSVAYGGRNVGSRFSFRMNPVSLEALRDAGFDIVSFANNHVGDYAMEGFLESLAQLTTNNILYAGAGERYGDVVTPTVIDVRGTKVGFLAATDVGPNWLAATDTKPGILLASDPDMTDIVARAQEQVDILVVSVHWGNEYSPASTRQKTMARSLVDAGADIVVGHHPHVMQALEEYNGKLIYYSLGNFIFDQYFSPHTMRGMVATVTIDPETKLLTHIEHVSTLSRQFIPQPLTSFDQSMLVTKTFTP